MIFYPFVFLVACVIAGVLNLTGLAAVAGQMSWILVGIVLVTIHAATEYGSRGA